MWGSYASGWQIDGVVQETQASFLYANRFEFDVEHGQAVIKYDYDSWTIKWSYESVDGSTDGWESIGLLTFTDPEAWFSVHKDYIVRLLLNAS